MALYLSFSKKAGSRKKLVTPMRISLTRMLTSSALSPSSRANSPRLVVWVTSIRRSIRRRMVERL